MKAQDSDRLFGQFLVVLEAKLVTPEGLAISIGSEFIENSDPKAAKGA